MKDLTQGSIRGHIVAMATPIAVGMLVQTLYFLVDLYFVSRIGAHAVAGVSAGGNAGGNAVMLTMALTQVLSVGSVALISHAVGAKDPPRANLVFNQSLGMAVACTLLTAAVGLGGIGPYMRTLGAGDAIAGAGRDYLMWYLPGLALQFPLAAMGSAMRGTGIAMPGMVVQMLTVLVNIVLAPVLIAGWGTGHSLGVAGAGLASSLAVLAGVLMMLVYFVRLEKYVSLDTRALWPRAAVWGPLLRVGLPAGGRVRDTLRQSVVLECSVMLLLALLCHVAPEAMIGAFTDDPAVAAVGVEFLTILSTNFVAMGFVFACSGLFQGMGNTWPGMASTATRLVTFIGPALWLAQRPGFALRQLWFLSVATVLLQAVVSGLLARWQLRRRLAAFDTLAREGTVSAPA
ncbi:MAG: MATE family efflux transporter [Burkholderiaceae bacterium]